MESDFANVMRRPFSDASRLRHLSNQTKERRLPYPKLWTRRSVEPHPNMKAYYPHEMVSNQQSMNPIWGLEISPEIDRPIRNEIEWTCKHRTPLVYACTALDDRSRDVPIFSPGPSPLTGGDKMVPRGAGDVRPRPTRALLHHSRGMSKARFFYGSWEELQGMAQTL